MALFKGKAKSKVDEALGLIKDFTEEELEEFIAKADLDGDGDIDKEGANETERKEEETDMTGDEAQIAEAVEDAKERGEEPTKAEIDESVGEQEHLDGDEDSQDARDRVDESEGVEDSKAEIDEGIEEHEAEDAAKISNMIREILREELGTILAEEFKKLGIAKGQSVEEAGEEEKDALKSIESIYNS